MGTCTCDVFQFFKLTADLSVQHRVVLDWNHPKASLFLLSIANFSLLSLLSFRASIPLSSSCAVYARICGTLAGHSLVTVSLAVFFVRTSRISVPMPFHHNDSIRVGSRLICSRAYGSVTNFVSRWRSRSCVFFNAICIRPNEEYFLPLNRISTTDCVTSANETWRRAHFSTSNVLSVVFSLK